MGFQPIKIAELEVQTRWGYPVREIQEAELLEVSPTAIPANRNAQIIEVRDRRRDEHQRQGRRRAMPVEKAINLGVALDSMLDARIEEQGAERGPFLDQLAEDAGVSRAEIDAILTAETECPPLDQLEALATALGADVSVLVAAGEADGCSYEAEPGEPEETEAEATPEGVKRIERLLEGIIGEVRSWQR